eukprot:3003703-Rhodomonas_salina.2
MAATTIPTPKLMGALPSPPSSPSDSFCLMVLLVHTNQEIVSRTIEDPTKMHRFPLLINCTQLSPPKPTSLDKPYDTPQIHVWSGAEAVQAACECVGLAWCLRGSPLRAARYSPSVSYCDCAMRRS